MAKMTALARSTDLKGSWTDEYSKSAGVGVEVEEKKGRWAEPGPRWSEVEVEEHERRWRRPGWGGVRKV